jgi:cytochrome c oxidase assembly protein Cox11
MTLTPEFFDTLVIVVIIIGLALAAVRLYRDLSRPLPPFGASPADDVRITPDTDLTQRREE